MNPELKKVKSDLKRIDAFCKKGPIPSESEVELFLEQNKLEDYASYASHVIKAVHISSWLCHQKKLNKFRI